MISKSYERLKNSDIIKKTQLYYSDRLSDKYNSHIYFKRSTTCSFFNR